jgi:hypothetical protein
LTEERFSPSRGAGEFFAVLEFAGEERLKAVPVGMSAGLQVLSRLGYFAFDALEALEDGFSLVVEVVVAIHGGSIRGIGGSLGIIVWTFAAGASFAERGVLPLGGAGLGEHGQSHFLINR